MSVTLKTRKPIVKLIASDFHVYSVWEFADDEECVDGQDETWVRPVDCNFVRKGKYSQIVASDFISCKGRKLQGFMSVSTSGGKIKILPGSIVGSIGYRVIPVLSRKLAKIRKAPWDIKVRDKLLISLDQPEVEVFPLKYFLRVTIQGEKQKRKGVLK
jgi:hypothetical protein